MSDSAGFDATLELLFRAGRKLPHAMMMIPEAFGSKYHKGPSLAGPYVPGGYGGGDTDSDCVGTARRQGAKEIFQLEILRKQGAGK